MQYQTELKAQGWRAVAKFADGSEAFLFLGRSSSAVRASYLECYADLLDDEEKSLVSKIVLERWHGAPDAGSWEELAELKVPKAAPKLFKLAA